MTSWQAPLAKLIGLIILLPFTLTYLHLYYYAYWKNEYCFVGPNISIISGKQYDSLVVSALETEGINAADNQKIRGDSSTTTNNADVSAQFYGIYAPISQGKKKKGNNNGDKRQFQQKYATVSDKQSLLSRLSSGGWPSITQASVMITSPSSQLSNHKHLHTKQDMNQNADHMMTVVETSEEKKWCLQSLLSSSSGDESIKWCSDPLQSHTDGTIYSYPTSGVWKSTSSSSSSSTTSSLYISCPTPATSIPSKTNSRHKQQNAKQNKNVQFLINHPATTLLLLLNTGLAFYYWNHRVNPSLVCKQYTKIAIEHEWWRGFTGATAHFEPLHIGFNMMSLNTLGRELEGGFGNIVFLVYNIALVVFTTITMMGMVYARLRWIQHKLDGPSNNPQLQAALQEQQVRLRETSSVGYSAVLFAWMVISTMERTQPTCPVPFFSDVCFSTYSVPGVPFLKFNIAPIVSLFVAQFIMPRVSFMGHLAGIICGYGLHWGWIPPLEVCSPNVLIGGVFLIGLIWRRRIIPVRPLLTSMMDEEGCVEHEDYLKSLLPDDNAGTEDDPSALGQDGSDGPIDPFMRSKQKKKEREQNEVRRKQRTLLSIRNVMGIVTVASLLIFGWNSSLVLSQVILLAYLTFATQSSFIVWAYIHSKVENDIIDPEKVRSAMIWKGLFMSATLSIVIDSMSWASWIVFPTLINSAAGKQPSLPTGLLVVSVFMLIRLAINLLALVLSSKILHDVGGIGLGIFCKVFGMEIRCTRLLGDDVFASQKPMWTAFEGRGITLGGRAT